MVELSGFQESGSSHQSLHFWQLLTLRIHNWEIHNSIILPLILSTTYIYLIYQTILLEEPIFDVFKLYLSLDNLYTLFATESFLLIFWLHFIALNLFLGSWISRDGVRYNMPRKIVFVPLILVYLSGPVGLVLYWIVRVFYAKRISFHD